MKICKHHYGLLRAAIDERGLGHLVGNVETAKAQVLAELNGEPDAPRDPLLSAAFAIMGVALEKGGLYLMEGELCPICEAMKHTVGVWKTEAGALMTELEVERWWIDGPANSELEIARENGTVAGVQ